MIVATHREGGAVLAAKRERRVVVKSTISRGGRYWVVACGGCYRDWWFKNWAQAQVWAHATAVQCCRSTADEWRAVRVNRRIDLWKTPTTSSGRFEAAKKSGDIFYGAKRWD